MKPCALLVIVIAGMKPFTVTAECRHGWEVFQESCYGYISQDVDYFDALTLCNKEGYDLLEVTSEEENKFVANFVKSKKAASVWLAINDIFKPGYWVYASTGLATSFSKLANPKTGQQHCMQLGAEGTWTNEYCGKSNFFVCEAPYNDHRGL